MTDSILYLSIGYCVLEEFMY